MSVTIETYSRKRAHIEMSIPSAKGVKTQKAKTNLIPEGYDANVIIGTDHYNIHEYRGRTGHTPGAKIIEVREDGTGAVVELNPENRVNAINRNIFRWKPK